MSKNLKFLQVVAKIAYVLCCIVFVCAIIGAAATALTFVLFLALYSISTPEINGIINFTGLDVLSFSCECLLACFACVGSIILAFMGKKYFKFQCEAGTPFTYEGAKKILKLGIADIIVTIAIMMFNAVVYFVYAMFSIPTGEIYFEYDFTLGLVFIFLSFVFKYGAELAEAKKEQANLSDAPIEEPVEEVAEETAEVNNDTIA